MHGLQAIKRVLAQCFVCKRRLQPPVSQRMSPLPSERLNSTDPPFTNVGLDYFGPLFVKQGRSSVKRYGCLFTCLACRAVHIEVAFSLSTDSFLCCLTRFMSRRGVPKKIVSDNGTNFVGAERELREDLKKLDQKKIQACCAQRAIEWEFIPPSAPHHGGVWERMVRTVKGVLKVIAGERLLDDEGLQTFMLEAERIVNGRPLTSISSDPTDLEVLTPNRILLLRGNAALLPGVFCPEDNYLRKRYRQAHQLANVFWERFRQEYIPLLQARTKWITLQRNICVGDVVLVVDELLPRGQWPLGLVVDVHKSRDELIRSVDVRYNDTVKERPVAKLCLLEAACDVESD